MRKSCLQCWFWLIVCCYVLVALQLCRSFIFFVNTFVTETPLDSIGLLKMLPQRHQDLAFPNLHGSGLIASELTLVYSTQKRTNGVWLLRRPVSVAQRNRQLSSQWYLSPSQSKWSSCSQTSTRIWWPGWWKHIRPFSGRSSSRSQFSILYPRNCNRHIFNVSKIQIFFSAPKILVQLFTVQSYLFFW